MPLRKAPKNSSKKQRNKIQSSNISELVNSYKKTGRIGNSKPKSKKAAIKQAIAISYAHRRKRK
jgi:hypothetical protein